MSKAPSLSKTQCQNWLFLPPLWVSVQNIWWRRTGWNFSENVRTVAKTCGFKNISHTKTQTVLSHTPELLSPSKPWQRPGGPALCLQAKAKRLPGNPAQRPVGIITVGWHLANVACHSQQKVTTVETHYDRSSSAATDIKQGEHTFKRIPVSQKKHIFLFSTT